MKEYVVSLFLRELNSKMIIEFTGGSSSGKSFFIDEFTRVTNCRVICVYDKVLLLHGLTCFSKFRKIKSLIVEMLMLPLMMINLIVNIAYYKRVIIHIIASPYSLLFKVNLTRNMLKVHALRSYLNGKVDDNTICYFDEGPIHQIHNICVNVNGNFDVNLSKYILKELTQVCDRTIIIKSKCNLVAERALKRDDAPWKNVTKTDWIKYAIGCHELYNEVIKQMKEQDVLILNNDDDNDLNLEIKKLENYLRKN